MLDMSCPHMAESKGDLIIHGDMPCEGVLGEGMGMY